MLPYLNVNFKLSLQTRGTDNVFFFTLPYAFCGAPWLRIDSMPQSSAPPHALKLQSRQIR